MAVVRTKWSIITLLLCIAALPFLYYSSSSYWRRRSFRPPIKHIYVPKKPIGEAGLRPQKVEVVPPEKPDNGTCLEMGGLKSWDVPKVLLGKPSEQFKDNLLPDMHYMTSWAVAGFTNQFIAYANMIYLSTLNDRIPIVPPFVPSHHISKKAGIIHFGDIFNVTHLQHTLRKPILEWRDSKALPPPNVPFSFADKEQIGCWSTRDINEADPFTADNMLKYLGLDVSYTRVPTYVRRQEKEDEIHVVFSELASLTYPGQPKSDPSEFPLMLASPTDSKLSPDEHLSCFDFLYYASSTNTVFEWEYSWSPAWRTVGKHLPFTDGIVVIARNYLARILGVTPTKIPKFIAVHARRGDFIRQCPNAVGECLPPLSAYSEKVQEIQEELLKDGIAVQEVIISSDETDETFWANARNLRWRQIDHKAFNTRKRLGEWYAPIIDGVIQSMAIGFVGTEESTFSLVSKKRVEEWNHGLGRLVQKGIW